MRVDEEDDTDDVDEVLAEYHKETWCIKKAADVGIFIPEVFYTGRYADVPYMIQKKLEGMRGVEYVEKHPDQNELLWTKLGQYARTLQSISTEGYGLNFDVVKQIFYDNQSSYVDFIDYNLSSLMQDDDKLITNKHITKQQSDLMKNVFGVLREKTVSGSFRTGLVHGDLSLRNIIVNDEGETYLLDWGCARVNVVPHFEIITVLLHVFNFDSQSESYKAFINGLGISNSEYEKLLPDLYAMLLLYSTDMVRWAMDHPDAIEHEVQTLHKVLALYFMQ